MCASTRHCSSLPIGGGSGCVTPVRLVNVATAGDVAVGMRKSPTLSCAGSRRLVHCASTLITSNSGMVPASCGEPREVLVFRRVGLDRVGGVVEQVHHGGTEQPDVLLADARARGEPVFELDYDREPIGHLVAGQRAEPAHVEEGELLGEREVLL